MTSSGIPKPAFYTYQLLKNISGDLLYREKNYFVVKDDRTSSTVYTIVVMNYNDEIEHLYTRSADVYKTNETINAFMDELNVDFTLPQTQVSIEQADTELNISASIHGAGINVIVIKEFLVRVAWNKLKRTPTRT